VGQAGLSTGPVYARVTGQVSEEKVFIQDILNGQTGKISWNELARHFARGVVVCVGKELDLLETAEILIADRADEVARLYEGGALHRALDDDAIQWQEQQPDFWAVVVAPWVLVQEI